MHGPQPHMCAARSRPTGARSTGCAQASIPTGLSIVAVTQLLLTILMCSTAATVTLLMMVIVNTAGAIPAPPTTADALLRSVIHRRVQSMSTQDMMALMALLVHEMIDLFDGVNDDSMVVKDCNGKNVPHHWLGDGFCDDGATFKKGSVGQQLQLKPSKSHGDFNCDIFACDNGDCDVQGKPKGVCRQVKGRDQVELKVDASAIYGHIKDRNGAVFVADLRANTVYHLWTNTGTSPYQARDTVLTVWDADAKTLLASNDDGPFGKASSYVKFRPATNIQAAVIKVTGKKSLDRGSFIIHISTKPPKCLKLMDCLGKCGGTATYDCAGVCLGKAKRTLAAGKFKCV
jgi:hypothetical protein